MGYTIYGDHQPPVCAVPLLFDNIESRLPGTKIVEISLFAVPVPMYADYTAKALASINDPDAKIIVSNPYEFLFEYLIDHFCSTNPDILVLDSSVSSKHTRHIAWDNYFNFYDGWTYVMDHKIKYCDAITRKGMRKPYTEVDFTVRSKHFVSLNHIARPVRVRLVNEIYRRNLQSRGTISLGGGYPRHKNPHWVAFMDEQIRHLMPLAIDEQLTKDKLQILTPHFTSGIIHVVAETTHEINQYEVHWGDELRVTEKTVKPLLLQQIPIFLSMKGHVAHLRQLGFDMFDDLVDHSYDSIENPESRFCALVDELTRLCSIPITTLHQYCADNRARFKHNVEHTGVVAIQQNLSAARQIFSFLES
jgi:hypothetical protein